MTAVAVVIDVGISRKSFAAEEAALWNVPALKRHHYMNHSHRNCEVHLPKEQTEITQFRGREGDGASSQDMLSDNG